MATLRTFMLVVEDTSLEETIVVHRGLYWYNLDYHHPQMHYSDGEPIVKGLVNLVITFPKTSKPETSNPVDSCAMPGG
jgi:hypothetical protein